jgi:hypothetical protein
VMPGSLVWRDCGRGARVRQRRTSQSTGAAGDASLESDVSGRRPVTLVYVLTRLLNKAKHDLLRGLVAKRLPYRCVQQGDSPRHQTADAASEAERRDRAS